ncbi:MAG: sigma factor-like helix-turn-helix DNA-binding protein [Patescibacteria group bacterium]
MTDQNSILDKVISSKQEAEIEGFSPSDTVSSLLKYLTNKEEDVLRRRFGLSGQAKETLEAIGKAYNVTRERIRQIENSAIKKIKGLREFSKMSSELEHTISNVLGHNGGIMDEHSLLHELLNFASDNPLNNNCAVFILEELISMKIVRIPASLSVSKSWGLPHVSLDFVNETIDQLVQILEKEGKPMKLDELLYKFHHTEYYANKKELLTDEGIHSYITLSKKIDSNPFDEYGLAKWGSINPKRMKDKIYLVLKKEGKPLHFNDITELINKVKFDRRKAYPPTVHNELILNNDFVLVGRGIYALEEWGYKPGVVSDVLIKILEKASEPLTRDELVRRVLDQRVVRKNTIHLALTDKTKFTKLPDKRYTLNHNALKQEVSETIPNQ